MESRAPEGRDHPSTVTSDGEDELRRKCVHYSGLVLASMLGCLIRLGLDGMASYDGGIIFPLAWAQGVGCGIMGFSHSRKKEINSIYPPLYTFLTTGKSFLLYTPTSSYRVPYTKHDSLIWSKIPIYASHRVELTLGIAGSVTTFSSWMLEGYLSFSNFEHYNHNRFHSVVDGFAYSFATFLIALGGFHMGTHFADVFTSLRVQRFVKSENRSDSSRVEKEERCKNETPMIDWIVILSAFISYLVGLLIYFYAPKPWRHRATFPILLSPPGTILRYGLSKLNAMQPWKDRFPIGTFIANIAATLILAGVFASQRLGVTSHTKCNALYAIQQGFCGCLSTVSTFVVESKTIPRKRWKWIFVLGSIVLGHVCVLGIVGGIGWTRGYQPVCTE